LSQTIFFVVELKPNLEFGLNNKLPMEITDESYTLKFVQSLPHGVLDINRMTTQMGIKGQLLDGEKTKWLKAFDLRMLRNEATR
jgi:hypothetical protein